jgi:hypothetical protein
MSIQYRQPAITGQGDSHQVVEEFFDLLATRACFQAFGLEIGQGPKVIPVFAQVFDVNEIDFSR